MDKFCHYYPAKLVIFNEEQDQVLLAKRSGEQEYDGVWNYPGGRKERGDKTVLDCLQREKEEELGSNVELTVFPTYAHTTSFVRSDDIPVVIGCYPAIYQGGTIDLNEDYAESGWFDIEAISSLQPTTPGMSEEVKRCKNLLQLASAQHQI